MPGRRSSSFGFLGLFGRSEDLRRIDAALREVGLHRAVVPEGAKLALSNLIKDAAGDEPHVEVYPHAVRLLAYCMLGPDGFADANGVAALDEMQSRVDEAIAAEEGADAAIVLLAHHAGLLQPSVVARHGISVEQG